MLSTVQKSRHYRKRAILYLTNLSPGGAIGITCEAELFFVRGVMYAQPFVKATMRPVNAPLTPMAAAIHGTQISCRRLRSSFIALLTFSCSCRGEGARTGGPLLPMIGRAYRQGIGKFLDLLARVDSLRALGSNEVATPREAFFDKSDCR